MDVDNLKAADRRPTCCSHAQAGIRPRMKRKS